MFGVRLLHSSRFLLPQNGKHHVEETVKLTFAESQSESQLIISDSLQPHGLYSPWSSPGQNTEMDSLSLLRGIFPTQRSNPSLPHYWWILY